LPAPRSHDGVPLGHRIRSECTIATACRNILVHSVTARQAWEGRPRTGAGNAAEAEVREQDLATEEAEWLHGVVRRQ
jgi:hypothetical protein